MNLFLWLEILCAITLIVMVATAYLAIAQRANSNDLMPSEQAAVLLLGTLIPALGIVVLWGRRVAIRRAGGTSARLHVNLVFFFSLIAAIPTLFVAVFASILFQSGVEFWFSDNSRGIMENANELAEGYYDENLRYVGYHSVTMAGDLRFFLQDMPITSPVFNEQYALQVYRRELSDSAVLIRAPDGAFRIPAIVDPQNDYDRDRVTPEDVERLYAGEAFVVRSTPQRIEAVTLLDRDAEAFLYIARNAQVGQAQLYQQAQNVVSSYADLTQRARVLQLQFNVALFLVSLFLVGLAVYAALRFADRQVKPLTELADAAGEIGSGNYAMRVSGRIGKQDEIGLLGRAFNRMTSQIERQTDALLGANHQLAERRAFMEAVLESITAGIVSLDGVGRVLLMNGAAQRLLLDGAEGAVVGQELEAVSPEIAQLVRDGAQSEIVQFSRNGELVTLAVQLSPATEGMVITFEDITRRLLDQRQAAWSDVARRIAHEIKNPLTPIQLATERLKRRYGRQIEQDTELFDELTGTIIRQVGDLRKMVDEFSNFARLPKPIFRPEDPVDLVRQALFLQEVANPDIAYGFSADDDIGTIECDRHQFGQAMTNVLKNAAEAIETRERDAPADWRGRIAVTVSADADHLQVEITDNGSGLPKGGVNVIEPYVTTREKGTGLGLAIVQKIVEEHGGELAFTGMKEGGTRATLRFARHPAHQDGSGDGQE
ncbi:HAMP domain-containing protein [Aurantiacibacter aquimixticola]|uniref:histidine kinase n=2 Tax=Aurantiacibacter aquimixticola TaxID=1958945 RepID=A0A419RWH6_9SPHN|nr:ATP-binding protein [Aurantiacibacter aquimixticola]RJY10150.1 HAMP domain-containing protein [Aurantiacibacter aquimixticola]